MFNFSLSIWINWVWRREPELYFLSDLGKQNQSQWLSVKLLDTWNSWLGIPSERGPKAPAPCSGNDLTARGRPDYITEITCSLKNSKVREAIKLSAWQSQPVLHQLPGLGTRRVGTSQRGWPCSGKQTHGNPPVLLSAQQLYLCQWYFQVSSS